MKIKYILLVLLFTAITITSCKKESANRLHTNIKLLRQTTTVFGGDTLSDGTYSYDDQGRVVHILFWDSTYSIYHYGDKTVDMIHYARFGKPYTHSIYTLNSDGLAISSIDTGFSYKAKPGMTGSLSPSGLNQAWTETFEYDVNGFLIKEVQTMSWGVSYTQVFTVSGGNTTHLSYQVSAGLSTYDYQFIPGSVNTIGQENFGIFYEGRQNTGLILSETINHNDGGIATVTRNYTYEFDNKNRVTKKTVRQSSKDVVFVTIYAYTD
jgi:hypothetical protein